MNLSIPNFKKARVLVIGDIMLDRYWHGQTSRISPEAPVPVVHISANEERAGGAGNVALNAAALGCQVSLLGVVGKDEAAKRLEKLLKEAKVSALLHHDKQHPTITKLRVLGQNQQLIRLDFEERFSYAQVSPLLKLYHKQLAESDVVIISDYGKGIAHCVPELITAAQTLNIPVLVDPKGRDFSIYNGATLLTPNWSEFTAVVGSCDNNSILVSKAQELVAKHNLRALLVTRGAQGMSLIHAQTNPLHIPTQAKEVYDVTGAGDTVIAVLGAALASDLSLPNATRLANLAAGIAVSKLGATTISTAELRRTVRREQESWLGVISEDRLVEEVKDAKAHEETIVMTNGCFDILHAGHVAYLEQAKSLGSRLIVAVNSDDSVKRLKGDSRPVNSLEQRMAVLAGLRAIDWVVPFSEDTPQRLIEKISPDILVKGGDYKVGEIAGAKHVLAHGGEVKTLQYIEEHSTSALINRIKEEAK